MQDFLTDTIREIPRIRVLIQVDERQYCDGVFGLIDHLQCRQLLVDGYQDFLVTAIDYNC